MLDLPFAAFAQSSRGESCVWASCRSGATEDEETTYHRNRVAVTGALNSTVPSSNSVLRFLGDFDHFLLHRCLLIHTPVSFQKTLTAVVELIIFPSFSLSRHSSALLCPPLSPPPSPPLSAVLLLSVPLWPSLTMRRAALWAWLTGRASLTSSPLSTWTSCLWIFRFSEQMWRNKWNFHVNGIWTGSNKLVEGAKLVKETSM